MCYLDYMFYRMYAPSLLKISNEGDYNCSDAQYFRSTSVNGSYLNKEKAAASLS